MRNFLKGLKDWGISIAIAITVFSLLAWIVSTIEPLDLRGTWTISLAKKVLPAVVQIQMDAFPPPPQNDEDVPQRPQRWWGSGIVVSPDGLVVSAYHVLACPDWTVKVTVTFSDGTKTQLKVVRLWKEHDLALGQLPKRKTPYSFVKISTRKALVGESVMVAGNPFALGHSVSSGILSALGRSFYLRLETFPRRRLVMIRVRKGGTPPPGAVEMIEMMQFDAPLNPGNSGGGLFDRNGELIGQTNAGMQGDGIGFAVPAKFILEMIKQYKG